MKKKIFVSILATIFALTFVVLAFSACSNVGSNQGTEGNGGLLMGDITDSGINLMVRQLAVSEYPMFNVMATAESAYTINATVYDESGLSYDAIQAVNYSIKWSAEKDDNVEDYVTLQQDGTQATLSCLKAFDTEIWLTCTSVINPEVKASVKVGYYKPIEAFQFVIQSSARQVENQGVLGVQMPAFTSNFTGSEFLNKTICFTGTFIHGTGTIAASCNAAKATIYATYNFKTAFERERQVLGLPDRYYWTGTLEMDWTESYSGFETSLWSIISVCCNMSSGSSLMGDTAGATALYRALANSTNQFALELEYFDNGYPKTAVFSLNFYNVVAPTVQRIQFDFQGDMMF